MDKTILSASALAVVAGVTLWARSGGLKTLERWLGTALIVAGVFALLALAAAVEIHGFAARIGATNG